MKSEKPKKGKEYAVPSDDEELDAGIEMTFPASDPPSVGGATKLKEIPSKERESNAARRSKDKAEQGTKGK